MSAFPEEQVSLIIVTRMHMNTGLSDTAERETVMNATLDKFAELFKNAIVIDDDIPIEKWICEDVLVYREFVLLWLYKHFGSIQDMVSDF